MEAEIKAEAKARQIQLDLASSMSGVRGNVGGRLKRMGSVTSISRRGSGNTLKKDAGGEEEQEQKQEAEAVAVEEVRPPAPPSSMDLVKAEQGEAPEEAVLGEEEVSSKADADPKRRQSVELNEEELLERRMEELHKEQTLQRSVKLHMEKQLPHHPLAEGDEEELLWQWDEFDPNMDYKVFVMPHFLKHFFAKHKDEVSVHPDQMRRSTAPRRPWERSLSLVSRAHITRPLATSSPGVL